MLRLRGGPDPSEAEQLKNAMELDLAQLDQAQLLQETRQMNMCKVVVVGDGRVGKTSLLRRLTRQAFMEGQASTSGIDVDVHLWQQSSGSGEQMEAGSEFTNAAGRAAVELFQVEQDREMQQQKEKEDQEKERQWKEMQRQRVEQKEREERQHESFFARKKREIFERQRAKQAEFQKAEARKNSKEAVMKTDYLAPSFGAASV